MRNDYELLINFDLLKEMRLLSVSQPKATQMMHLFLAEMDENNNAMVPLDILRFDLKLEMEPLLDMARTIQQMGWLSAIAYDTDVIFATVNPDLARLKTEHPAQ